MNKNVDILLEFDEGEKIVQAENNLDTYKSYKTRRDAETGYYNKQEVPNA